MHVFECVCMRKFRDEIILRRRRKGKGEGGGKEKRKGGKGRRKGGKERRKERRNCATRGRFPPTLVILCLGAV